MSTFHENATIITGASSGIGRELAYQLAERGAWLALAARSVERLEETAAECERRGGRAALIPTDVRDAVQCRSLVEQTAAAYGRIDTLVNNAGISMWTYFEELDDLSHYEEIMRVNYLGSVYTTYYALPYLKQTQGRIVAISSLTGKTGVPTRSGYAASKHAMVGFFDSLRIELAGTGVSVTTIYPGFVATEIRERAINPAGQPWGVGNSPVKEDQIMPVEQAVQICVRAIEQRRRDEIMTLRGKVGQWLKLIAPGLVDRIALGAIRQGK